MLSINYFLEVVAFITVMIVFITFFYFFFRHIVRRNKSSFIKVGILHSLTGTMAISEKSVVDAMLLAIDDINLKGGVLGRKIKPIIADGCSDADVFAKKAEKLILKDKVSVIFGCWTSDCRKAVKVIVEKHEHLLVYPLQYEGLEESKNIIYCGAIPNQQIIPAIKWVFDNLGKRFFLVGSDYIFPHTANEIIKDQVKALKGEVVGEEYLPLGSSDASSIVSKILKSNPDVIINTINGSSNVDFFKALRKSNIMPSNIPSMSFSIGAEELKHLNDCDMVGDYAAWSYFQEIPSMINQIFVQKYKEKYGKHRVTDDPIETGYLSVLLWSEAAQEAKTDDTLAVREVMKHQFCYAPEGRVAIDADNQHTARILRIGKIRKDGKFDIVWTSGHLILPSPYPEFRTKQEWDTFLHSLYKKWGNRWSSPEKN
ncbi:urea ABC transporter substrate-binding protein [Candidatus Berkiella cookevillensis]|nr:urea ABC transporter substrate-binding protein [Candidatus Berkiella cookevillensis]MCS5708452.1 urea ABC transporter substrate-binding protein [Candidatus Berkiella cookevillensis]